MLFVATVATGATFHTTSSALGISEVDAADMRDRPNQAHVSFVLSMVADAASRLAFIEPAGSC
jgi:hypothetical protein